MHECEQNGKNANYLILHKTEWDRLKQQSRPPQESPNEQKEYVQSLIEKSREWTETWPDHQHGLVAIHEQVMKKKRDDEIATIKEYHKKLKRLKSCKQAVELAKRKIFEQSCYGVKLLSAFRESKAIEERDMQIKFKKELRAKQESENKNIKTEPYFFLFDKDKSFEDNYRKCIAKQMAQQNKEIYEKQKAENIKAKEAQKQEDLKDLKLMTELLKLEEDAKMKFQHLERETIKQNITEHKHCKEERAKQEADYYDKIEKCRKEKEILQQKIDCVFRKVTKNTDLPWTRTIFDTFALCQEEEKKRYDEFIENSIKLGEYRSVKREQRSKDKEKASVEKSISIAKTNKNLGEFERQNRCTKVSKCFCDRQSLMVKSHKIFTDVDVHYKVKQTPNFKPLNNLTTALKMRMQKPSPWTGATSKHEEFARHADDMLRECKYKQAGRKVVDEYKINNGLKSLDVPNYN